MGVVSSVDSTRLRRRRVGVVSSVDSTTDWRSRTWGLGDAWVRRLRLRVGCSEAAGVGVTIGVGLPIPLLLLVGEVVAGLVGMGAMPLPSIGTGVAVGSVVAAGGDGDGVVVTVGAVEGSTAIWVTLSL